MIREQIIWTYLREEEEEGEAEYEKRARRCHCYYVISEIQKRVTEGSVGSTAISLATVAPAYRCKCHVVIPDDAAIEKSQIIEALGATVERVRPVSITHKDHYGNIARRRAEEANELASKRRLESESNGIEVEDNTVVFATRKSSIGQILYHKKK